MARKKITTPPWVKDSSTSNGAAKIVSVDEVKPNADPRGLDDKLIELFVSEYVKDFNLERAALRTQYIDERFEGRERCPRLQAQRIVNSPLGETLIDRIVSDRGGKVPVSKGHIIRALLLEAGNINLSSGDRQKALNSVAELQGQKVIKTEVDMLAKLVPTIILTTNKGIANAS